MTELKLIERPDGTVTNDTGNDPGATRVVGTSRYWLGVDLAQSQDFTALCCLHETQLPIMQDGQCILGPRALTVVYADRFKGVSYPAIVDHMVKVMAAKPFAGRCKLTIDASGLGRVVFDLCQEQNIPLTGIQMVAGQQWTRKGLYCNVGKSLLVENLAVLFASGELKFASDLPLRQVIEQDLASFTLTETAAGNQIITQNRQSGSHGDLAIGLACAAFSATYLKPQTIEQAQLRGWY